MLMAGTGVASTLKKSKWRQAACAQLIVTIVFGAIFAIAYLVASDTNVPVESYQTASFLMQRETGATYTSTPSLNNFTRSDLANLTQAEFDGILLTVPLGIEQIVLQVDLATFYAGLMAWLGWFLFAIFGGIGLAALPLDLMLAFVNRPKHLDAVEFAEVKVHIQQKVNELVEIGELLKIEKDQKIAAGTVVKYSLFQKNLRKEYKEDQASMKEFKAAVFLLEQDVNDFNAISANYEKYNPLKPYLSLLFGIVSVVLTLLWILQICLCVLPSPSVTPFLNDYFEWFDGWFPLFGVLSVAIFTVYLLFCAIKGCFKFGLRFMFIDLHPMRPGRTYMSSFMFNIALVLMCSLPVVQLASVAFAVYAQFSTVRQIFGVQIENLQFFGWFWRNHFFVYALLAFFGLTSVYLTCKPKDAAAKSGDSSRLRDRLRERRS